jgi:DegV family protein with EDD domain
LLSAALLEPRPPLQVSHPAVRLGGDAGSGYVWAEMKIRYLDGPRLRRGLIAACEHARNARAELNRINVFPVPDGDTGTNLALTCSSIVDRLQHNHAESAADVARDAAEAGVLGARGNCGMILSHFFLGFAEGVGTRMRLTADDFSAAMANAVRHLYQAIERPIEGTILTVIRETAEEAEAEHSRARDFTLLFERLGERARTALARTQEMLPTLRAAGVVDAGAKGFVELIEGIRALIHGNPIGPPIEPVDFEAEPAAARIEFAETEKFRFCTEALVRGDDLPEAASVRATLRETGDSLIVIRTGDVLKVHVHTDDPDGVFAYLRAAGTLVSHKAEDMHAQHDAVERAAAAHIGLARRPASIVTDSACDLPPEVVQAHGIHVVPLSLVYDQLVLRDGVDIDPPTFVQRLRSGEHPTTSQPPPAAFLQAFRRAAEEGEEIIAVLLSGGLSGTLASAEAAAKQIDAPIHIVDSLSASLGQGLLALRAAELAESGVKPADIAQQLIRIRDRSTFFFTIDTFDRLLASGRVSRSRAWLGGLLDVKPILGLDREGRVRAVSKVLGSNRLLSKMLDVIEESIPVDAQKVRFGVVEVDAQERAEAMRDALAERFGKQFGVEETLLGPATPVLATHIGVGAWGVGFQVDE